MENKKIKQKLLSLILAVILIFGVLPVSSFNAGANNSELSKTFVPGEALAPADSMEHAQEIAAAYGLQLKSYANGIAVLIAPNPEQIVSQSKMKIQSAGIPRLSLNRKYHTYEINDTANNIISYNAPDESLQWHHGELDTKRAWKLSAGTGVVVAVIDTGVDINHVEFTGRLSAKSYNSHTNQTGLAYVSDDTGHGTHVSGIIAASKDYGNDVCGVAPGVTLMVLKANISSDPRYFDSAAVYSAINYAVNNGANIINLSLGREYYDGVDELEQSIIANAVAKGVTVICAAGNQKNNHAGYPASYSDTIAVSATTYNYKFDNNYSNYGPEIDVAAPGSYIYSTKNGGGYANMSGTSMSAPSVTGIAALLKSINPGYTPQQIRAALRDTAMEAGPLGRDDYYGYGVANAYAAVLGANALYKVTYNLNDGANTSFIAKAAPGGKLIMPVEPVRSGYIFIGWYKNAACSETFDFSATITGNMTLYAKWLSPISKTYAETFPDMNFRREVLRLVNQQDGGKRIDSSIINLVDTVLIATKITHMNLNGINIHDMYGLKNFYALEYLWCNDNKLTELDISNNVCLTYLDCRQNYMKSINDIIGCQSVPGLVLDANFYFYPQNTPTINGVTISVGVKSHNPKNATTIRLLQSGVEKYKRTVKATTGTGQFAQNLTLPEVLPGTYTLEITKPGHLKYTKTTLIVSNTDVTLNDVTLITGDLDGDGYVGYNDFLIFLANYNKSGAGIINQVADIDGDGYVGYNDFIAFLSGYGKSNVIE